MNRPAALLVAAGIGAVLVISRKAGAQQPGNFVYSSQYCGTRVFPGASAWFQPVYSITITNDSDEDGARAITFHAHGEWTDGSGSIGEVSKSWQQTLKAGQSVTITSDDIFPVGDFEYAGIPLAMGYGTVVRMHIKDTTGAVTDECEVTR